MVRTYPNSRLPIPYHDAWLGGIDNVHHPHDVVDDLDEPARDGVHRGCTQRRYSRFGMHLIGRDRANVTPTVSSSAL